MTDGPNDRLEHRLRGELREVAERTTTDPNALTHIVHRAEAGRSGRRRARFAVVAAAAALALLVGIATQIPTGEQSTNVSASAPDLSTPPALTGRVVAAVDTVPCSSDCVTGVYSFPAGRPEAFSLSTDIDVGQNTPLPDGSYFDAARRRFEDPAADRSLGTTDAVWSAADHPDGRIVVHVVGPGPRGSALFFFDPATGQREGIPLPDDHLVHGVAVGPDGSIASLGDRDECCLNRPELYVLRPDGSTERHELRDNLGQEEALVVAEAEISWGTNGLIAVSGDRPERYRDEGSLGLWTVIIDPSSGEVVRAISGWEGLAWSPDGRGIMLARRTGARTSEVAVFWGEGFRERIDVGTTTLPVLPRFWLADDDR